MPDRFGLGEDGDGRMDFYSSDQMISPSGWLVDFDACASSGSIVRFDWEVNGVPAGDSASCDGFSHTFPAEGAYQVSLTVSSASGATHAVTRQVAVQDWLIVAVGDGYASGEGNPNVAIPQRVRDELDIQKVDVDLAKVAYNNAQDALDTAVAILEAYKIFAEDIRNKVAALDEARRIAAETRDASQDSRVAIPGTVQFNVCVNATADAASKAAGLAGLILGEDTESSEDDLGSVNDTGSILEALISGEAALDSLVIEAGETLFAEELALVAEAVTYFERLSEFNAVWQDQDCHRSSLSGPAQAALALEQMDPRTSVTFVNLACSGAGIDQGLTNTQPGVTQKGRDAANLLSEAKNRSMEAVVAMLQSSMELMFGPLGLSPESPEEPSDKPAQIARAAQLTEGRHIDALVASVGAVEANLQDIIFSCVLWHPCDLSNSDFNAGVALYDEFAGRFARVPVPPGPPVSAPYPNIREVGPGQGTLHSQGQSQLDPAFADLDAALAQTLPALLPERVYLTEYPPFSRLDPFEEDYCADSGRIEVDNLPGVSAGEYKWLETTVFEDLNQAISGNAALYGWTTVQGIAELLSSDGYCADDSAVVRIPDSFLLQGDINGAYHPNSNGLLTYKTLLSNKFRADFYNGGDLASPRLPNPVIVAAPLSAGPLTYELRVASIGPGDGRIVATAVGIDCRNDCSEQIARNTVVNLGFSPGGDSTFAGWGAACNGLGGCTVTMDNFKLVTARFETRRFPLSVDVFGTGQGSIVSSPIGIDCGSGSCSNDFPSGRSITLTPNPSSGLRFFGWSGVCSGVVACSVSMDSAKSASAIFVPDSTANPEDAVSGKRPVTVVFSNISSPGLTSLQLLPVAQIGDPDGFVLGAPRELYQLGTFAEFTGRATVCMDYSEISYGDPSTLRLFHYTLSAGGWTDVTTFRYAPGQVVCGAVTELPVTGVSVFGVFERTPALVPPAPIPAPTAAPQPTGTPSPGPIGPVPGKGFVGELVRFGSDSIIVLTGGRSVQLTVDGDTVVNDPPSFDVGMGVFTAGEPARVAVLSDRAPLNADGSPASPRAVALKVTVVPVRSTRSHKRVIAAEKCAGGLSTLDSTGKLNDVTGGTRPVNQGDSLVLLVQSGGSPGDETVKSFVKASSVDERLERILSAGPLDPLRKAALDTLLDQRDAASEARLLRTASNASLALHDTAMEALQQLHDDRDASGRIAGAGQAASDCALKVLGRKVAVISGLNTKERRRLIEECFTDRDPPRANITSPEDGATVAAGSLITVTANASDNNGVARVVFSSGSIEVEAASPPYTAELPAPTAAGPMKIEALAFDREGNTWRTSITLQVSQDPPPTVNITGPRGPSAASGRGEGEGEGGEGSGPS